MFSYCLKDIDDLSVDLGIVWEKEKDQPFAPSTICIGFVWDVENRVVSLSPHKISKYLQWLKKVSQCLWIFM